MRVLIIILLVVGNIVQSQSLESYIASGENENLRREARFKANLAAENLANRLKNDSIHSIYLLKAAQNCYLIGDWQNSKRIATNLKNSHRASFEVKASAYRLLGLYHAENFTRDSAYYYFRKAASIFKNYNAVKYAIVNLDIAVLYYNNNNFYESEQIVFKTLKKRNYVGEEKIKYKAISILALIYADCQDYETSIEYNLQAIQILNENGISSNLSKQTSLNNLGLNYQRLGRFNESIEIFKEAMNGNFSSNLALYSTILENLTYSRFKAKQNRGVESDFLKTLQMRIDINDIPGIIINLIHLSEYYFDRREILKAREFAEKGYLQSKSHNLPVEQMLSLQQLIKVDTINQGKYIEEYIRISDSVKLVERRNHNKFARIAYETDEITQQKEEVIRQKHIITGSASALLAILGLTATVLYQRSRNRKLQFQKLQQDANSDIHRLMQERQHEVTKARDQEKKRIARELHDGVMNRLSGTRLNLEILKQNQDSETINKCLGFINQIQDVEKELRSVSHDLSHNTHKVSLDFGNMLKSLIEEQVELMGAHLNVEFAMEIDWPRVANTVKMAVYRITQEALSNCKKYAQAKNVYVTISTKSDQMYLSINDDGKGFDVSSKRTGIGIKNMKARVKVLKGKFDITSNPGIGTAISVAIPLSINWFEPESNT